MPCTSYTPVFYPSRDNNIDGSGFSWQLFSREARRYSTSMPQYAMDRYLCYDNEIVRKIVQNHEATFRYQVQELHQLYRRQRELMDEMRVNELFMQHSQLQRNTGHENRSLDLEYDDDDDQQEQFNEVFFSEGRPNLLIDLNAPAPMQLEEAKRESVVSLMAIDLNSLPLSCLSETASEIPLLPLKNEDRDDANAYRTTALDCISAHAHDNSGIDDNFLKVKTCIDLNTDINTGERELSSNVGIKSGAETDLEAPVSPENKEGPPPRGKPEDIQLEPTMELDGIAANTLIMISSARTESLQCISSCLCWFAGIVSSTGDDLHELVGDNSSNGIDDFVENHVIEKEKEKDIQTRKRKNARGKARKCSKLSPSDKKKSRSSICSVLHGWGQVRKREGGRTRPNTKRMLLFSELAELEKLKF